jgi:hypothetical protein
MMQTVMNTAFRFIPSFCYSSQYVKKNWAIDGVRMGKFSQGTKYITSYLMLFIWLADVGTKGAPLNGNFQTISLF